MQSMCVKYTDRLWTHSFQLLHGCLITPLYPAHVEIENMTVWLRVQLQLEFCVDQQ